MEWMFGICFVGGFYVYLILVEVGYGCGRVVIC